MERLQEVNKELEQSSVWDNPERAQALGKEKVQLEQSVLTIQKLDRGLSDASEMLVLAEEEQEPTFSEEVQKELADLEKTLEDLEFRRMFSGKMDPNNAYVDIQSGSGGTEAQDWAEMLLRMYLRWANDHGFTAELVEASPGDVAGIKSATIHLDRKSVV